MRFSFAASAQETCCSRTRRGWVIKGRFAIASESDINVMALKTSR